jgi:hypothetical protein
LVAHRGRLSGAAFQNKFIALPDPFGRLTAKDIIFNILSPKVFAADAAQTKQ